jgi:hypothetical protein
MKWRPGIFREIGKGRGDFAAVPDVAVSSLSGRDFQLVAKL